VEWGAERRHLMLPVEDPTYICQVTQVQYQEPLKVVGHPVSTLKTIFREMWGVWAPFQRFLSILCTTTSARRESGVGLCDEDGFITSHAPFGAVANGRGRPGPYPKGGQPPTETLNLQPGELVRVKVP